MSVKDIRSQLAVLVALSAAIGADGNTPGGVIDTADYELGLMFSVSIPAFTDGQYDLVIEESDDPGMAGATVVGGDKLIGDLPSLTAASTQGSALQTVGVISNKRYVRATIAASGVTTGATVTVHATQKAELAPVA